MSLSGFWKRLRGLGTASEAYGGAWVMQVSEERVRVRHRLPQGPPGVGRGEAGGGSAAEQPQARTQKTDLTQGPPFSLCVQ